MDDERSCEVSFIVPAFQAARTLRASIESIRAAAPAGSEVIIVDDGSFDGTEHLARELADVFVGRPCQGGAARARNDASLVARGRNLFFVDADVTVTPEAVGGALRHLEHADAVFGAYAALPPPEVRNVPTTFKNLLHHHMHVRGAGDAETFWSGFGAVRRRSFTAVGGFDAGVTTGADVEDIDLGYRLRAAGFRIVLDPSLQVLHHKSYTLRGLVASDVFHRAIPWTRALLQLRHFRANLNLQANAFLGAVVALSVPLAGAASWWLGAAGLGASIALAALWGGLHRHFLTYAWRVWGRRGAVSSAALLYLYYLYSVVGAAAGVIVFVLRRDRTGALNRLPLEPVAPSRLDVSLAVTVKPEERVATLANLETLAALPAHEQWWELLVVAPVEPDGLPAHARFLRAPAGASRNQMRQIALKASQGEMFATLDAGCVPDPGWLERVREAATGNFLVVAGSFHHQRKGVVDRADQVVRFWQWRPERPRSWTVNHPFNNIAFRRRVALRLGGFTVDGALILRLAGFGARPVFFEPLMGACLPGGATFARTLHGVAGSSRLRSGASARYFAMGRLHRLVLVATSPLLAGLDLVRIVRGAVRERSADRTFWLALPLVALGVASHWFGRDLGLLRPRTSGGVVPRSLEDLARIDPELSVPVLR